jgi:ORF6N domain
MNDLELAKIERRIYSIRGVRVILDADLAALYGVSTKRLNEQFRRNRKRFPDDFAFQLTAEEASSLRSQFATAFLAPSSIRSQNATASKRNVRYRPWAFTEHGALQAANIGHSRRHALASYPSCFTAYPRCSRSRVFSTKCT